VEFQDVGEGLFVMDELNDGYSVKAELFRRGEKLPIAGVIDGDGANNNPNFKDLSTCRGHRPVAEDVLRGGALGERAVQ
jgi:hypothetical protein